MVEEKRIINDINSIQKEQSIKPASIYTSKNGLLGFSDLEIDSFNNTEKKTSK